MNLIDTIASGDCFILTERIFWDYIKKAHLPDGTIIWILTHPKVVIDNSLFDGIFTKYKEIKEMEKEATEAVERLFYCGAETLLQKYDRLSHYYFFESESLLHFMELMIICGKVNINKIEEKIFEDCNTQEKINNMRKSYGINFSSSIFAQVIFICDGLLEMV